jgi:hypothetical protein
MTAFKYQTVNTYDHHNPNYHPVKKLPHFPEKEKRNSNRYERKMSTEYCRTAFQIL